MLSILGTEVPAMRPPSSVLSFLRGALDASSSREPEFLPEFAGLSPEALHRIIAGLENDFWNSFVRLQVGALFGEGELLRAYCRILPVYRPSSLMLAPSLN
jgi:hypothetical protein